MTVWTISAQAGTGGGEVAAGLARAAGVPLLDRDALASLVHELDPDHHEIEDFDEIEERLGGRLNTLGFSVAMTTGPAAATALQELQFRRSVPKLGRAVLTEAARHPGVILSSVAFAVLQDHPAAIHVRLHAPVAARIAAYQREHLVDRRHAEKAIRHDDHITRSFARSLYHLDFADDSRFTLALDASRLSRERLIEILLAAGGTPTLAATGRPSRDPSSHQHLERAPATS